MAYKHFFDLYNQPGDTFHYEKCSIWRADKTGLNEYLKNQVLDTNGYTVSDDRLGSARERDNGWGGTENLPDALKLLEYGWMDGVDKIPETNILTSQGGQANQYNFDVHGESLDVGVFMSGDPECFLTEVSVPHTNGKIIRIAIANSFSGGVEPEHIQNRGLAIMSLVDALECNGYSCAVDLIEITHSSSRHLVNIVELKDNGQAFDREGLLFSVAHPASLRRIGFRLIELNGGADYSKHDIKVGFGYGTPDTIKNISDYLTKSDLSYDLIFDTNRGGINGVDTLEMACETIHRIASEEYGYILPEYYTFDE